MATGREGRGWWGVGADHPSTSIEDGVDLPQRDSHSAPGGQPSILGHLLGPAGSGKNPAGYSLIHMAQQLLKRPLAGGKISFILKSIK